MACCGYSMESIFQASYLVTKGWTYSPTFGWQKFGHSDVKKRWVGGNDYDDELVDYFEDVEKAYDSQKESEF